MSLQLSWKEGIRAGTGILLVMLITHFFHMQRAYWVVITMCVVLQGSVGSTWLRFRLRVLSTIFGVVMGAFLVTALSEWRVALWTLVGLMSFYSFWMMFINYYRSILFLSAALIIALLLIFPEGQSFVYARILDTVVGAAVALFVSAVLWPVWAKEQLKISLKEDLHKVQSLTHLVLESLMNEKNDKKQINESKLALGVSLEASRAVFNESQEEMMRMSPYREASYAILCSLERIRDVVFAIHGIREGGVSFCQSAQTIRFIQNYQTTVDKTFKNFIQKLDQKKLDEALPSVIDFLGKLPVEKRDYATQYLQRNLDRIFFELNHIRQAFQIFIGKSLS